MSFNLFLDDLRPAPGGWVLAKTVDEAKGFLSTGHVQQLSLGRVLGCKNESSLDIARFIVDSGKFPARIVLHSGDLTARKNMFKMLLRYGPYRVVVQWKELAKV